MRGLGWQNSYMFVSCLASLPNLHTIEIGFGQGNPHTQTLKEALGWIRLPQIKTLIIPESAHPLLKHCRNVEDVVWVIGDAPITSSAFLQSLASNWDSKVKRLTIPLVMRDKLSRKRPSTFQDHRARTMADRL